MRLQILGIFLVSVFFAFDVCMAEVELTPAEADSFRAAAEMHLREGRLEGVIDALKEVVDSDQRQADDYLHLGYAFLSVGKGTSARKAFEKAIKMGAAAAGNNGIGHVYLKGKKRRKRALRYFERAVDADPAFAEAHYNLAMAYLEFRPSEAPNAFMRTIEADSSHGDAYYQVGRFYEAGEDTGEALEAYRRQVEVNPRHVRAQYRTGKLLFEAGRRGEAVQVFKELMRPRGDVDPVSYLEMARINQDAREFDAAQRFFELFIGLLPGEEQRIYHDISLVASRRELEIYKAASGDQKEELARRFWNRYDPAPLSRSNERLVEHYRRVAHAREHYSRGQFPWDDRGEVYIRFGPPDHISRWNDIQTERDPYIQDARQNFVNRKRIALRVLPGQPIFPVAGISRWEYWVYTELDEGTEVTFVNEHRDGRYTFAPIPSGLAPSLVSDLLEYHGPVVIQRVAARTPSTYSPDFADLPIDFFYYPADYRGQGGQTRLEVYYGLPASEVARLRVNEETDLVVLERGLTLYDSLWREVHRVQDTLSFHAPTQQQVLDGAFIPGELSFEMPAGSYHMSLQVRDEISGKSQVYNQEIVLEDYGSREALQISDIELAFWVSPTDEEGAFVKKDLKVIPMSSRAFRKNQNAFVYFEIYNLKEDAFGQTRYRVEYTFRSDKDRAAPARVLHGFGRLFRLSEKDREVVVAYDQAGDQPDEVAYVELDLTEAEPGGQLVRVTVTDLSTDREVSKEITFQIDP